MQCYWGLGLFVANLTTVRCARYVVRERPQAWHLMIPRAGPELVGLSNITPPQSSNRWSGNGNGNGNGDGDGDSGWIGIPTTPECVMPWVWLY